MRKIYIVIACLLIAAVCLITAAYMNRREDTRDRGEVLEELRDTLKEFVPPETAVPESGSEPQPETNPPETDAGSLREETEAPEESAAAVTEESEPADQSVPETEPAETEPSETEPAPVTDQPAPEANVPGAVLNFADLEKLNPDICAWIEIEDTKVDYPVLQSPTDDKKYLSTAYDGSYYIGGSLFTERTYNSRDFSDPVTVIYGHTMRAGTLFGQLQSVYSDPDSFAEHNVIKLYLPGETRSYKVFAAVPYESIHILHTYDFSKKYWFNNFFDGVRNIRSLYANFDDASFPSYGDKVLILSTCLNEDSTMRFLVMASLEE